MAKEKETQQILLNECLDNARAEYNKVWNDNCKKLGRAPACSPLPLKMVEALNYSPVTDRMMKAKEECWNKYDSDY